MNTHLSNFQDLLRSFGYKHVSVPEGSLIDLNPKEYCIIHGEDNIEVVLDQGSGFEQMAVSFYFDSEGKSLGHGIA